MILASTTAEIKKWVSVSNNFEPENLIPSANEVKKYIIDIIGDVMFNELIFNYPNALTPEQTEIFPIIQKSFVNLAMWHYADNGGQLEISQAGFHINTSKDRKTAFEWQINQVKRGFKLNGFNALQELLLFLWKSNPTSYLLWRGSANKDEHLQFFCNDAIAFSRGYNIQKNYLLFCELKDTITFVEQQYIIPVIQEVVAIDLKSKIKTLSLNGIESLLIDKINLALASMVIYHAIPKLANIFSEHGVFEKFSSMNITADASNPARDTTLSLRLREANNTGEKYLVQLGRFMLNNADEFPLYEPPTENNTSINDIKKSIYIAGL